MSDTSIQYQIRDNDTPFGDYIVPTVYIWIAGNKKSSSSYKSFLSGALKQFSDKASEQSGITTGGSSSTIYTAITANATKFYTMAYDIVRTDSAFVAAFYTLALKYTKTYGSQIPLPSAYFSSGSGNITYDEDFIKDPIKTFDRVCELLATLLSAGVIDVTALTGIRPVNIYTGLPYEYPDLSTRHMQTAQEIGLPASGIFVVNPKRPQPYYQSTFTGTDAYCVASVGNVVSELNGLSSISWSIFRGKSSPRTLGKVSPSMRSRGSRTVAGTMIFVISDHHPLLDIIPSDMASFKKITTTHDQTTWQSVVTADQIPAFDITIMLVNEYGKASMLVIYGVDILNEGSVISIDNLMTEVTLQYTAVAIDPIYEVEIDEASSVRLIDPFAITRSGYSDFYKRRDIAINGVSYSDYDQAYDSYYTAILTSFNKGVK